MKTPLFEEYRVRQVVDLARACPGAADTLWGERLAAADLDEHCVVHNAVHIGHLSLHYVEYATEVRSYPRGIGEACLVLTPLSGNVQVLCGRQLATIAVGSAAVTSAHEQLSVQWSPDCRLLVLKLDAPALLRRLSALIRTSMDASLLFELAMDLRSGTSAQWWRYVDWLVCRVDAGDRLLVAREMAAPIWNHVATALLLVQPSNYTSRIHGDHPDATLGYVRAAIDFIEAHPERPLTVRDIAGAAGVSVRTLQHGFRDQLDDTPMRHLYRIRIQRVHDELLDADPESSRTVDDVTAYWKVAQTSKFYRDYRHRFGERPAATKRTAQRGFGAH